MKKITLRILLAGLVLAFLSVPAFATDCSNSVAECDHVDDDANSGSGIDLVFSPNVEFGYNGSDTAYGMASWNSSGSKGYAATSAAQGLYVTKADITSAPTPPDAGGGLATADWAVLGK